MWRVRQRCYAAPCYCIALTSVLAYTETEGRPPLIPHQASLMVRPASTRLTDKPTGSNSRHATTTTGGSSARRSSNHECAQVAFEFLRSQWQRRTRRSRFPPPRMHFLLRARVDPAPSREGHSALTNSGGHTRNGYVKRRVGPRCSARGPAGERARPTTRRDALAGCRRSHSHAEERAVGMA